uniref:Putative cpij019874 salivary cysteine-rich peptide n=1 Tax=Aedes albopictus TaxID=7160 RepID=A0A023EEW1_AEDAL|nr:WAP, Kazal, immunoglobulin, Kunitz and NTR domain-containing protein 2-like [Aedes albopictus]
MAKFLVLGLVVLAAIAAIDAASFGQCPVSSKVQTCTPKCLSDVDCSTSGGKCCPNTCNYRSCVSPNQLTQSGSGGSSGNKYQSGGAGTYCGNVKCSAHEKCDLDKSTKRQKCVRA